MTRDLVFNLAKHDLFDRYAGSVAGGCWSIIRPLINISIFILVFSKIMGARLTLPGASGGEYSYSIYLVSGVLMWNLFSETTLKITSAFQDKSSLIRKVHISLVQLPFYIFITEGIIYWFSLFIFSIFLIFVDHPITITWLWLPVVFVLSLLLAYFIGFLAATLSVFMSDVKEIVGVFLQVIFWLTPIVYILDILPEFAKNILTWNPIYWMIHLHRDIIIFNSVPNIFILTILAFLETTGIFLVLFIFRRLERDIRDMI